MLTANMRFPSLACFGSSDLVRRVHGAPIRLVLVLLGSVSALQAPVLAQVDDLVLDESDTLLLGDSIDRILDYSIGNRGDWAASVLTNLADLSRNQVLIVNGEEVMRRGDLLPGAQGVTAVGWGDIRINQNGRIAMIGSAEFGASSLGVVLVDGEIVLRTGSPIPGGGSASRFSRISLDDNDVLSVLVSFLPVTFSPPLALVEIDLRAAFPSPTLIRQQGDTYPNGNVVGSVLGAWRRDNGQVLTWTSETTPSAQSYSVLRLNDIIRLSSGDPTPVPGTGWNFFFFPGPRSTFDTNASGQVAWIGNLSTSWSDTAVAVDNQLIVQRGQTLPINGSSVLTQIDSQAFGLTDNGRVVWYGHLDSSVHALFRDDIPVMMEGEPAAGSTIAVLPQAQVNENLRPVSDNGAFFLQRVELADGREGLLRRQMTFGSSECSPANLNSSGAPGRMLATGSPVAGGNPLLLIATQLPRRQFGLFVTGMQADSILLPGSQGILCMGGNVARFNDSLQNSRDGGQIEFGVDTTAMPLAGQGMVQAGQSWRFQAWFRDNNPTPTSNLTDAIVVQFQ